MKPTQEDAQQSRREIAILQDPDTDKEVAPKPVDFLIAHAGILRTNICNLQESFAMIHEQDYRAESHKQLSDRNRTLDLIGSIDDTLRILKAAITTQVEDTIYKLSKHPGCTISHKKLGERLKPGGWLTDDVILFFLKLLEIYSKENDSLKVMCLDTTFMGKILSHKDDIEGYDYDKVKGWMKEDVENYDIILCPINIGNRHWTLAAVHIKVKKIQYYDSLGQKGGKYLQTLRMFLNDKGNTIEWNLVDNASLGPQQQNGYDCGVFVCISALWIMRGKPPSYHQSYISLLGRECIKKSIESGKLNAVDDNY